MALFVEPSPVVIDGNFYDLNHLKSFIASIPGKGIGERIDLDILVVFSNHVFTKRTQHGERHHMLDHNGTKRTFDKDRYAMSKTLGEAIKTKIEINDLTYVSKSFGGIDNLLFLRTGDGRTWTIVYCLKPMSDSQTVRMEVLSAYPKVISQAKISRRNLSYYARKCLFEKRRIPND